jgi:TatD DNase family protein
MIGQFFSPSKYLDFHTHSMRQYNRVDVEEIISIHLGQEREKECFTVGLHPWWTESVSERDKASLKQILAQPNCLAMGEMGLDKLKGPSLETQIENLRALLRIADELGKSVVIHCVRAYGHLTAIKKEFPNIKRWCVHGYGRHATLAKQLTDQGFYLSLMPTTPEKYQILFGALPNDRIFLETDSMAQADIVDIYRTVSSVTGLDEAGLKRHMYKNAIDFFQI